MSSMLGHFAKPDCNSQIAPFLIFSVNFYIYIIKHLTCFQDPKDNSGVASRRLTTDTLAVTGYGGQTIRKASTSPVPTAPQNLLSQVLFAAEFSTWACTFAMH